MSRAHQLVQPGVLKFVGATIVIRVAEKGRDLSILVETAEGTRHAYLVETHPNRLGAVGLTEVRP